MILLRAEGAVTSAFWGIFALVAGGAWLDGGSGGVFVMEVMKDLAGGMYSWEKRTKWRGIALEKRTKMWEYALEKLRRGVWGAVLAWRFDWLCD